MNLQVVLSELNKKMSDAKIGVKIGASQATVTRLRNGVHKKTFYDRAEAIKKLAFDNDIEIHEV